MVLAMCFSSEILGVYGSIFPLGRVHPYEIINDSVFGQDVPLRGSLTSRGMTCRFSLYSLLQYRRTLSPCFTANLQNLPSLNNEKYFIRS